MLQGQAGNLRTLIDAGTTSPRSSSPTSSSSPSSSPTPPARKRIWRRDHRTHPTEYTVIKATIGTLICPSDGIVNTCFGYSQYINYVPGNFNYVANTGHPRNILLPGDSPNTGSLPPSTGILSMSPMYLGQLYCQTAAQQANLNTTVTLASVTDGTSNTAEVSESLVNDGSGNSPDKRRNLYYTPKGYIDAQNFPRMPAYKLCRTV